MSVGKLGVEAAEQLARQNRGQSTLELAREKQRLAGNVEPLRQSPGGAPVAEPVGPLLELGAQERPALGGIAHAGAEEAIVQRVFQDGLPEWIALDGNLQALFPELGERVVGWSEVAIVLDAEFERLAQALAIQFGKLFGLRPVLEVFLRDLHQRSGEEHGGKHHAGGFGRGGGCKGRLCQRRCRSNSSFDHLVKYQVVHEAKDVRDELTPDGHGTSHQDSASEGAFSKFATLETKSRD